MVVVTWMMLMVTMMARYGTYDDDGVRVLMILSKAVQPLLLLFVLL